jgi:predicted nucleic acid-binding protein
MPSPKTSFVVFDTSIYVENFRTGRFLERMRRSGLIPRCAAVVLHELLRGARSRDQESFVRDLGRNCLLLTPTEKQWQQAAGLLRAVRRRQRFDKVKLATLAFDVLIALGARSIGATLVTTNRSDFEAIRRELVFEVEYW